MKNRSKSAEVPTVPNQRDIELALYWHMQALRLLGRTDVNTLEIAMALELPIEVVDEIAPTLEGVKRSE